MNYYKIYCHVLRTDLDFERLVAAKEPAVGSREYETMLSIIEKPMPEEFSRDEGSYAKIVGNSWHFSNSYLYMLVRDRIIIFERKSGAQTDALQDYLLGWGLSMLFYLLGNPAIHCSCISKNDKAYMLSGNSGSGKSTATDILLNEGFNMMADDIAVILEHSGEMLAAPAFPFRKLCSDAAEKAGHDVKELKHISIEKDKYLIPYSENFSTESVPVKALVVLRKYSSEQGNKVFAREITGADKLFSCMDNLFLNPLLGADKQDVRTVMPCLKLASSIRVFEVARPDGIDTVVETINAIRSCIKNCEDC